MTPAEHAAPDRELDLTVSLTEAPGAPERVFRLTRHAGGPVESDLPDPAGAVAAVERFGEGIFFPAPGPPMLCTQQYGGPQVAVVTGTFGARQVHCRFSLTDGCEIARWHALSPLLGGISGSTGAI
ncbi:serine protease inhibitor [Arthrobacter sp. D1-17]